MGREKIRPSETFDLRKFFSAISCSLKIKSLFKNSNNLEWNYFLAEWVEVTAFYTFIIATYTSHFFVALQCFGHIQSKKKVTTYKDCSAKEVKKVAALISYYPHRRQLF